MLAFRSFTSSIFALASFPGLTISGLGMRLHLHIHYLSHAKESRLTDNSADRLTYCMVASFPGHVGLGTRLTAWSPYLANLGQATKELFRTD